MSKPALGEIAILVDQVAAAEAALAAAMAELERLRIRARQGEAVLADGLIGLARRAIAAARPDPAATAAEPAVSVILPVFDRSGMIGDAIRSVLAQTFAAWELIVVDDGSTDAIDDAVAPFRADPRIRFVRQPHAGVAAARNRGLALARGTLIAYIDSDNFWFPGFLEAAAGLFAAQPETQLAYAALLREGAGGARLLFEPFERDRLLAGNYIDLNVVMHRRGLYGRLGGFDETLGRAVDLDLVLRYTAARPAAPISVAGACYRSHRGPRISLNEPLAPNLFAIRRKWRRPPERRPRVLYAVETFPQLSETYIAEEMACMRRFGAEVAVWAGRPGHAPGDPTAVVHRGTLAEAIRAARPEIVHVHWLTLVERQRETLAAAGVPATARAHSFDSSRGSIAQALKLETLQRIYLLPATASADLPVDPRLRVVAPAFDTSLFKPAHDQDRRLVLRATAGLRQSGLRFMLDLGLRLPNHRVVLAIARAVGEEGLVDELRAHKEATGSPTEIRVDVPRPEMAALFARAAIYVHTFPPADAPIRKRLGGPVSIAEAMASGAHVLVRDVPGLVDYVGDAGTAYRDADHAAALIRATEGWSDAEWAQARLRSIERAYTHHADEAVLAPIFADWCALLREREEPSVSSVAAT